MTWQLFGFYKLKNKAMQAAHDYHKRTGIETYVGIEHVNGKQKYAVYYKVPSGPKNGGLFGSGLRP